MLHINKIKPFVPTTQPEKAKQFYQNTLGLNLVSVDQYALEFEGKESSFRVTTVQSFEPHPFAVLGWEVDEIVSLVQKLKNQGVKFEQFPSLDQNNLGIWTAPSEAQIAWFKDPDGNLLSLTQMSR